MLEKSSATSCAAWNYEVSFVVYGDSYVSDSFKAWHDHYHAEGYDNIDTTSQCAKLDHIPIYWQIDQQIKEARTQRERQMRLDSLDFGADCGLTIPIHGPAGRKAILLVEQMQGEDCLAHWQKQQYPLFTAAQYYYAYLYPYLLQKNKDSSPCINLSKREQQCLQYLAQNHGVTSLAHKLGISERTVNFHIQNLNKKLGVNNKYRAVTKALQLGLIG